MASASEPEHQEVQVQRQPSSGGSPPDLDPNDPHAKAQELEGPPELPAVLKKLQKWGDYASFGNVVHPTRFIPMKTPLSREILANWSLPEAPKYSLTIPELLEAHGALGKRIGMVLDLSNHDCLYTEDLAAQPGIAYCHINLVAKELPPPDYVRRVCAAANAFWADHPDDHIAIHCAYGFNRTGFVLCSYLIEVCGLSVEDALDAFATARPPGVKHEAFRAELHARYGNCGGSDHSGQQLLRGASSLGCISDLAPGGSSPALGAEEEPEGACPLAPSSILTPGGPATHLGSTTAPTAASTPDLALHARMAMHATPISENDSLGVSDRVVLSSLRAHAVHSSTLGQHTPDA